MPLEKRMRPIATREIRAEGPRPDAESLRVAYLELLKLALCDLAGPTTHSVTWYGGNRVLSHELSRDELADRAGGTDWPLSGLTMIGLSRLDDLQSCVEAVVADSVEGDLLEAGAWRGGASILIRATLDSLGAADREVWVADSFEGFPEPDPDLPEDPRLDDLSDIDLLTVPLDDVRANFARFGCERGVRFVPGFFQHSLPELRDRSWSLLRLDGDTYHATSVALEALYSGLSPGGYVIVDDYCLVDPCRQAVDDFRRERGISEPLERIDWNGVRWRKQGGSPRPSATATAPLRVHRSNTAPPVESRRAGSIPTQREAELERELEAARERLNEAELAPLRRSPLASSARWMRRQIGRSA